MSLYLHISLSTLSLIYRFSWHPLYHSITPEVIAEAAAAGITNVKMYPQGKTSLYIPLIPAGHRTDISQAWPQTRLQELLTWTNSILCSKPWKRWASRSHFIYSKGIMLRSAKHDMVLNLHGEVADLTGHGDISHEEAFLPRLKELHERFPKLRLVNTLFYFVKLLGVLFYFSRQNLQVSGSWNLSVNLITRKVSQL